METALATITAAIPTLFGLVGTVLEEVMGNPILVLGFASAFVGMGVGIFRKLRKV